MTEPQVWAMIGVFTTIFLGTITVTSTLFVRVVRAEVGGLRGELGGLRGELGGLRAEMNARFEAVDRRFEVVNNRIDSLDRDVQTLVKHTFGLERG